MTTTRTDRVAAYRAFCEGRSDLPLFAQPWWLDTTAGQGQWDVALVRNKETILASHPFVLKRRFSIRVLSQPKLTQTLGPWIAPGTMKQARRLQYEKEVLSELADNLPVVDIYVQSWHPSVQNWLPFYWKGFRQSTRLSYALSDLSDADALWAGLQSNIRREVKKARARFGVRITQDESPDRLYALLQKTYMRQNRSVPYTYDLLKGVLSACRDRGCTVVLIAEDEDKNAHAGALLVWDRNRAYYLVGGGDPDLRNSGATSLCLWESIMCARQHVDTFDFEGSMVEPIERYFRAFGAQQSPYSRITKARRWIRPLLAARGL